MYGDVSSAALEVLVGRGRCRSELGRYREAEADLLLVHETLTPEAGEQSGLARRALDQLSALYERWDLTPEAGTEGRERPGAVARRSL